MRKDKQDGAAGCYEMVTCLYKKRRTDLAALKGWQYVGNDFELVD
jgi:hypothetical protein